MIPAGQLPHRIQIYSLDQPQDSRGGFTNNWTLQAVRFGKVEGINGREFINGQQVDADCSHIVTIRFFPRLKVNQRLVESDRILNIKSIIDSDARKQIQVIACTQVVGNEKILPVYNDSNKVIYTDSGATLFTTA